MVSCHTFATIHLVMDDAPYGFLLYMLPFYTPKPLFCLLRPLSSAVAMKF